MQKIYLAVLLAVTAAACSSSGGSTKAAAPQGKAAEACGTLATPGEDGTVSPLLCSDGHPSKAAVAYYTSANSFDATVLHLPATATLPTVRTAMCADVSGGGKLGLQTETQAFQLAQALHGWTFTVNAVDLSC